jgi:hypothetical protein
MRRARSLSYRQISTSCWNASMNWQRPQWMNWRKKWNMVHCSNGQIRSQHAQCFDLSRSLTSCFFIANTARCKALHVPNQVIANTARCQVLFGPNPEPYRSQATSGGVGDQRSGNLCWPSGADSELLVSGEFVVKCVRSSASSGKPGIPHEAEGVAHYIIQGATGRRLAAIASPEGTREGLWPKANKEKERRGTECVKIRQRVCQHLT